MTSKLKLGIIISTTRPGRLGEKISEWTAQLAAKRTDATFEVVDLREYPLPFFDEKIPPLFAPSAHPVAQRWAAKMAELDGYLFVTAEYNHSISGVLKNALDYLGAETQRKPATFVGYGGAGGARAVEHLRGILAEMQVATLKQAVHIGRSEVLGLLREGKSMDDFPYLADFAGPMFDELTWWATTLAAGRERSRTDSAA
ncbi:MAG TPA: NAD(P)H-dependent oxidoreductase [Polyangiaceae bacterium]|nr:NAD(P)H-dependent oxidoreductase [Polyangiaceae bacterium]